MKHSTYIPIKDITKDEYERLLNAIALQVAKENTLIDLRSHEDLCNCNYLNIFIGDDSDRVEFFYLNDIGRHVKEEIDNGYDVIIRAVGDYRITDVKNIVLELLML